MTTFMTDVRFKVELCHHKVSDAETASAGTMKRDLDNVARPEVRRLGELVYRDGEDDGPPADRGEHPATLRGVELSND
ncbi:MAG: hypothetical protein ACRC0L_06825, partial [Angustibacter sp.]